MSILEKIETSAIGRRSVNNLTLTSDDLEILLKEVHLSFYNCILQNILIDNQRLNGISFYDCVFKNVTFSNSEFKDVWFGYGSALLKTTFNNCSGNLRMGNSNIHGSQFTDSAMILKFIDCTITEPLLRGLTGYIEFEGCTLNFLTISWIEKRLHLHFASTKVINSVIKDSRISKLTSELGHFISCWMSGTEIDHVKAKNTFVSRCSLGGRIIEADLDHIYLISSGYTKPSIPRIKNIHHFKSWETDVV